MAVSCAPTCKSKFCAGVRKYDFISVMVCMFTARQCLLPSASVAGIRADHPAYFASVISSELAQYHHMYMRLCGQSLASQARQPEFTGLDMNHGPGNDRGCRYTLLSCAGGEYQ